MVIFFLERKTHFLQWLECDRSIFTLCGIPVKGLLVSVTKSEVSSNHISTHNFTNAHGHFIQEQSHLKRWRYRSRRGIGRVSLYLCSIHFLNMLRYCYHRYAIVWCSPQWNQMHSSHFINLFNPNGFSVLSSIIRYESMPSVCKWWNCMLFSLLYIVMY